MNFMFSYPAFYAVKLDHIVSYRVVAASVM